MQKAKNKIKIKIFNNTPFDMVFFLLVIILLGVGLIMVLSASFPSAFNRQKDSYFYFKKQLGWAGLGLVAMYAISKIDYNILRLAAIPAYICSTLMLILVAVMGSTSGGAGRWLVIGPVRFQPSEITKLSVILILALYVAKNYSKMKKFTYGLVIPGVIIGLAMLLVILQPHLSGTIIIFVIGISIIVVGGANWKWLASLGSLAVIGGYFTITTFNYMTSRIEIWRNPGSDPLGKGFQTLQSLYAIGSGGLFGLGLGQSRQKYHYIPEPQNDFIFAIVCEELGFIGAMIIILLFLILCYRGFVIAWNAPDKFGALIVTGITVQVAIQTLLNIAVVTNTIPVTGISLPFFSYGGTALTMLLAQMGIILSVSRQSRLRKE